MPEAERVLLAAVARAVLSGDRGELANQLDRPYRRVAGPEDASSPRSRRAAPSQPRARRRSVPPLTLANGLGGLPTAAGSTRSRWKADQETPLPWANVIANPGFGTVVTASGAAYTWSENSRENRLTPFANDPVSDPTAEALFVRDEDTGDAWAPDTGPDGPHAQRRGDASIRHSAGLTRFGRVAHGIRQSLDVFVDAHGPGEVLPAHPHQRGRVPPVV